MTITEHAELGIDDIPLVGGKNASLGEMYRQLTPQGILIPNGFEVTAQAYPGFLTGLTSPRWFFESTRNFVQSEIRPVIPLLHKTPCESKYLRDHPAIR